MQDSGAKKTQIMVEAKKTPVVGWLVALNGHHKGEDFRIREGKNTIGKSPECDIVLTDDYVSTVHAHLNYREVNGEKQFIITDMDSTNGTFLNENDEPISREELVDADTIIFGETRCKFKCL